MNIMKLPFILYIIISCYCSSQNHTPTNHLKVFIEATDEKKCLGYLLL